MKKKLTPILTAILVLLALVFGIPLTSQDSAPTDSSEILSDSSTPDSPASEDPTPSDGLQIESTDNSDAQLDPDGTYTSKEDVALYIHLYQTLPQNFITKSEARALGWEGGGLEEYAPGKCIGGDRFGNYEGLLPEANGRSYTECDIDTLGKDSRGAKRIVFSNDGLVYYTEDHYESFVLLYGDP